MRSRLCPALLAILLLALPVAAQEAVPGETGSLVVRDWPASAVEAGLLTEAQLDGATLLPDVETLRVGYELVEDGDRPRLTLLLEWTHGRYGRLDGERVPYERLPEGTRLVALELHARAAGPSREPTDFHLALHDLDLLPGTTREVRLDTIAWTDLFPNLAADSARALLADGLTLSQPQVLSAAFVPGDAGFYTQLADRPDDGRTRQRRPGPTVVTVDPGVWIDVWIFGPPRFGVDRPRAVPSRPRGGGDPPERTRRPARATTDRDGGSAERDTSGTRRGLAGLLERGKGDDEEDDEDDASLLPAALAGAAAVGVLAYAGGTVGYYGHSADAPFGLSAGFVRPSGGVLVQAAINPAVIQRSEDEPEHLVAKVTGFLDVLRAPVQPALGAGVYAEELHGEIDYAPTLSFGGVLQQGPGVFYVGYDVVQGGLDVSLAFNFRARR